MFVGDKFLNSFFGGKRRLVASAVRRPRGAVVVAADAAAAAGSGEFGDEENPYEVQYSLKWDQRFFFFKEKLKNAIFSIRICDFVLFGC